jgi:hypothetical protein
MPNHRGRGCECAQKIWRRYLYRFSNRTRRKFEFRPIVEHVLQLDLGIFLVCRTSWLAQSLSRGHSRLAWTAGGGMASISIAGRRQLSGLVSFAPTSGSAGHGCYSWEIRESKTELIGGTELKFES